MVATNEMFKISPVSRRVPEVLQPFMPGGLNFLPFKKAVDQKRLLGGKKTDKAQ